MEKVKNSQQKNNQAKVTRSNEQDNTKPESYLAGQEFMTQEIDED